MREHELYVGDTENPKFHVLLTTYEIVRRDKTYLDQFRFKCLAVDEAHRLKDDSSALYRDLYMYHTESRLLVTGTPLQNSIKELWCLLHFLEPRKFNSLDRFQVRNPS